MVALPRCAVRCSRERPLQQDPALKPRAVWKDLFVSPPLSVVRADYPPDLAQPSHAHDYASVTLILSGAVEERVGSRSACGGTLAVVVKQAGVEHACRWGARGARTLSLELDPVLLARERDGRPLAPWTLVEGQAPQMAVTAVYDAVRAGRLEADADDLPIEVLASLERVPEPGPSAPPPWRESALEELADLSPVRPATRELAERAGVHPVHFARVFRHHVGRSPTAHALRLRLRAALDAIASDPSEDVGRIAHRAGYADHSHLCREVRRGLGLTPTTFRELVRPVGSF
jgi:AraC family transcriptional regulator